MVEPVPGCPVSYGATNCVPGSGFIKDEIAARYAVMRLRVDKKKEEKKKRRKRGK